MISHADRFGATWWGRLWINGLEKLGDDYENRLPRGKKYAEEGAVSRLFIGPTGCRKLGLLFYFFGKETRHRQLHRQRPCVLMSSVAARATVEPVP